MYLIKETLRLIIVNCIAMFVIGCSQHTSASKNLHPDEVMAVFKRAQLYINQEAYSNAYKLYEYFIKQYPNHPLADDAAYRLCYIHVIGSGKNVYLNYLSRTVFWL